MIQSTSLFYLNAGDFFTLKLIYSVFLMRNTHSEKYALRVKIENRQF